MGDHGRGSLKHLGGNRWRYHAPPVNGKRPSTTITAKTKKDAWDQADRFRAKVRGGEITGDTHTLAQLIDEYMAQRSDLEPSTVREYQHVIKRHIVPAVGGTRIDKLTAYQLSTFYRSIPPSAARTAHGIIKPALHQATVWAWVGRNVANDAKPPAPSRRRQTPPTDDALDRILANLTEQQALYVQLAVHTGARRGELCALRWGQVDLDAGSLTIDATLTRGPDGYARGAGTKTDADRRVALGPVTLAALKAHRAARAGIRLNSVRATAYVFSETLGDHAWNPQSVSHWFRRAADTAGFPGRLHDLRHKHATDLLHAGHTVIDVAQRLGHARTSTTLDVYGHAVPANDQALAATAERLRTTG